MTISFTNIIMVVAYLLLAPLLGGILAGVDRKISARMQGRYGPPILQPFYDFFKLLEKEKITVNRFQDYYVFCFLLFIIITGAEFFIGGNLLLVIFTLTLASVFLVVAAYSSNSAYSQVGAERELLQTMSYEPMVLLVPIAMYMVTAYYSGVGSFNINDIVTMSKPAIIYTPGIFLGFLYILTIKLRKSPFDLSYSHHGHQEIVKGITTEMSGRTLAMIELAHWYENIFILGLVYIFFAWQGIIGSVVAVAVCLLTYFLEILIDNNYARVKWQLTLGSSWLVAATLGIANIIILYIII